MQRRNLPAPDSAERHPTEHRQDVPLEDAAIGCDGSRLAMRRYVHAHEAFGERGHGQLRLRDHRHRVLSPLDAVDDDGGLLAGLVGGDVAVEPERDSFRSGRASRLHDVGLAPRGLHPHAEACQVPVPEDGILRADGERIHRALGDTQLASSRHRNSPKGICGCLTAPRVRNQTAIDRHQTGAYWSAESAGAQDWPGTKIGI